MISYFYTIDKYLVILFTSKFFPKPLIGPISGLMIAVMTSKLAVIMPWTSFTSAMVGRY